MAVTSAPRAMPPEHLWDPKQRVHISGWHYKKKDEIGCDFIGSTMGCYIYVSYIYISPN